MDILEAPYIIPEHRDVFHVGPVNMKRRLLLRQVEGRGELAIDQA